MERNLRKTQVGIVTSDKMSKTVVVTIKDKVKTPGVVFALAMAVRAFTKEGEAVMIQQPVYYPFSSVIKDNGRKLVSNTLVQKEDGHYEMDLADFERKVKEEKVKLFPSHFSSTCHPCFFFIQSLTAAK